MFNLIKNEWIKIFSRPGTYVMIGLLVLLVVGAGSVMKFMGPPDTAEGDWKQQTQMQVESDKQYLKENEGMQSFQKQSIEEQIAINEYRLDNDIEPASGENMWSFVNFNANFIDIIGLFAIIIAAGIVAGEFTWGTIKLLLIRPISRTKILLSKYITVLLFGVTLLLTLFVLSTILGAIFFGGGDSQPHLVYIDGSVEEQSMLLYSIKNYLLSTISITMMATMAFMISAVFRNSSLAIGISLFLLFMGSTATGFIALKYDWAKYSLFANTDLRMYTGAMPKLVEDMTLGFSITVLIVYFLIFHLLAFFVFNKRDVAA
ncbi:ABC transporter permease [Bacillus salacetis]|uniref:ABC transporter permease n=1 Tax=Bacillus salacetis TaxID=2315464 RepID=A0A3A1R4G7_9BACI|nr:ABC transporter permease [Bacillus salacetis]RIW37645.1 ABC transporter permease [Bacillus salacetis]